MNIKIEVHGLAEVEEFMEILPKQVELTTVMEISKYVYGTLLPRIKKRLMNATASHTYKPYKKGSSGGSVSGGYGVPSNHPDYKEWKDLTQNLPLVGGASPRELVATGFFLEKIEMYKLSGFIGQNMTWHVGAAPGERLKAKPMSNDGSGNAKFEVIENQKLAQLLEDSEYAFWSKEYEDVQKDVYPLVMSIIEQAVKEALVKVTPKIPVKA